MPNLPTYVLIAPARNEAQFIERTLESVVMQTMRPIKWLIVSGGSTDGTDDIVRKCAAQHPWIEFLRMPERRERQFAGKAYAFNAGYKKVAGLEYDVIGNLDAAISFERANSSSSWGSLRRSPGGRRRDTVSKAKCDI